MSHTETDLTAMLTETIALGERASAVSQVAFVAVGHYALAADWVLHNVTPSDYNAREIVLCLAYAKETAAIYGV